MDLQEFLEEMGYDYDGLLLDEGATGGYCDAVKSRGLSYVTFSSEQVKSIENRTPTADPDIRYSDRDTESLFPRALLANAFEDIAQTDDERKLVAEYREQLEKRIEDL